MKEKTFQSSARTNSCPDRDLKNFMMKEKTFQSSARIAERRWGTAQQMLSVKKTPEKFVGPVRDVIV